jgi:hypothetical protein
MTGNAEKKPHRRAYYSPLGPTPIAVWWNVNERNCTLCGSKELEHEAIDRRTEVTFEPTLNPECHEPPQSLPSLPKS